MIKRCKYLRINAVRARGFGNQGYRLGHWVEDELAEICRTRMSSLCFSMLAHFRDF